MAARAECPPHSLRNSFSQERTRLALYMGVGLIVVAVGVVGLEKDSRFRQFLEVWINIHALFGFLLCGLVLVRYRWVMQYPLRLQQDVTELSRHLSRIVYLVLYAVMGVSQGISLVNCLWHGGSVDFALVGEHLRNADGSQSLDPHHDCHMILLWGGIALGMIRIFLTGCLIHRYRGEISSSD